ncbi:hypothetical protein EVJ58_g7972 [Rhodofomes roseus]|uniref:Uncharacterized protein n=1 Tax=Rhodofomes roseus TaxID=34475 RepID=A0A4Y9Y1C4_9APHY|nr:hypothetical protein EVJ58_g7972 [Rhodofomes roseus]
MLRMLRSIQANVEHYTSERFSDGVMKVVNATLEMEASVERVTQALHGLINWELREPLMDLDIADRLIFHDTDEDMTTLKQLNVIMLTFDQVFQRVIEPAVEAAKAAKAAEEAQ